jgi:hypothetical protein
MQIKATTPYYNGRSINLNGEDVTFDRQGIANVTDATGAHATNPAEGLPFVVWSPEKEKTAQAELDQLLAQGGDPLRDRLRSLGLEGLRQMATEASLPTAQWQHLKFNSMVEFMVETIEAQNAADDDAEDNGEDADATVTTVTPPAEVTSAVALSATPAPAAVPPPPSAAAPAARRANKAPEAGAPTGGAQ